MFDSTKRNSNPGGFEATNGGRGVLRRAGTVPHFAMLCGTGRATRPHAIRLIAVPTKRSSHLPA